MANKSLTRMTRQRMAILDVLRSTTSHPTADWVYAQVRDILPKISLGTVYRNLNLLREIGEIQELTYGSNFSRFDGNPKAHPHFHCISCNRVFDLDFAVEELARKAEQASDYKVERTRLEFEGVCRDCLGK
jgi:Fur family peroxide stress response transcriptional regulator